ncbi:MAG TPA: phospholipid carrier-dependent glycosyltransferase, partial [Roseiflexaceae bacterium]|nr:phospholipid carrier-dependent glycosyltransferase [Roseiflexaceae bacterium]
MSATVFSRRRQAITVGLLLFVLALMPRVSGLADFATTDEAYHWIDRTARFWRAVGSGNWAATLQTGHPGVTLMWLGSAGMWLEGLFGGAPASVPPQIAHLAWLRLAPALFEALLVPLAYGLLRRLVQPEAAACAALLWATSPYLVAHSRLLHLDALLTGCVTLSILLLLVACAATQRHFWLYLALSGGCAGLALLTKGPALIVLPFAGLTLFALIWHQVRPVRPAEWRLLIGRVAGAYLAWLAIALLVVVALWPALWVIPNQALARYIGEITDNGGRPNGDGQFFFGQALADPGPFFYPAADLFRTTPAMLLGLLAVPLALQRRPNRRTLIVLAAFVLFWTLVMSLGPKKFDRYVLPTWPALLIL